MGRTWLTGVFGLFVGAILLLSYRWMEAQAELNQCFRDATEQERQHNKEKQAANDAITVLNYKLGILTAKVEYLEKKYKRK